MSRYYKSADLDDLMWEVLPDEDVPPESGCEQGFEDDCAGPLVMTAVRGDNWFVLCEHHATSAPGVTEITREEWDQEG